MAMFPKSFSPKLSNLTVEIKISPLFRYKYGVAKALIMYGITMIRLGAKMVGMNVRVDLIDDTEK
ncbi:MAG TPA: hypothetical protein VGL34_25080 [Steroidobacteraceae bacterium]|jgi:hypothetical protein